MLTTVNIMFNAFMDICRLRKRPQDIPKSSALFFICLAVYLLLSTVLLMLSVPVGEAVIITLTETGLLMLVISTLLRVTRKTQRWTQTMTALFGTGIVLSLFAIPLSYFGGQGDQLTLLQSLSVIGLFVLIVWNLIVMAHILKHALQVGMITGVLIVIACIWLVSSLLVLLLPETS